MRCTTPIQTTVERLPDGRLVLEIPPDVAEQLGASPGDAYVAPRIGGVFVSFKDAQFAEVVEIEREVSTRYANALQALADS